VSHYYLDASALVKRYVDEVGSDWLRTIVASTRPLLLFTSRMTIVEVISAFARRVREGSLSSAELAIARDAFRGDCLNEYQIMPPTMTVIDLACVLLEQHPLRAYDATHLATALGAQQFLAAQGYPPLTFLSADDRLNRVATAEGLQVDNPNHHP
jgi:predicted nucleic acid-binding protein